MVAGKGGKKSGKPVRSAASRVRRTSDAHRDRKSPGAAKRKAASGAGRGRRRIREGGSRWISTGRGLDGSTESGTSSQERKSVKMEQRQIDARLFCFSLCERFCLCSSSPEGGRVIPTSSGGGRYRKDFHRRKKLSELVQYSSIRLTQCIHVISQSEYFVPFAR